MPRQHPPLSSIFSTFRPRLWPSIITTIFVVALLALGTWQLERRAWKHQLIETVTAQQQMTPLQLPTPMPADISKWAYRPAVVTGTYDHTHEFHILGRALSGALGYYILTPLRITHGAQQGQAVLVNRGFVPMKKKDPATRQAGYVYGEVTVRGLVIHNMTRRWFMPENDAAKNIWFDADHAAFQKMAGYAWPAFVLAADKDNSAVADSPLGGQTRVEFTDHHLMYALFWYTGALACAVIFVLSQRQKKTP